jgi:hypothetical protein
MIKSTCIGSLVAAAFIWLASSGASAQTDSNGVMYLPSEGGVTHIGSINFFGTWYAGTVTQRPNGTCLLMFLSGTGPIDGHRQVIGGNAREDIRLFSWDTNFCGYTIRPLTTNGFVLQVYTASGNDRLENYIPNVNLNGGPGNDVVVQWEGAGVGGQDADDVHGDAGDRLFGDTGNDRIKVHSGTALLVDGGDPAGTDKLCGNASQVLNIDQRICNW